MEGFLDIKMHPMARRLLTRALAIVPAGLVVAIAGDAGLDKLLVISQVVLSFQLPFAVVPLVLFVTSREMLGVHAAGRVSAAAGWACVVFIIGVNFALVASAVRGDAE